MLVAPRVQRVYRMPVMGRSMRKKMEHREMELGETLCCRLLDFKLDP